MSPSNKEYNTFHIDCAYPQGLHVKETQANTHMTTNLFHATKTKYPQFSCDAIPTIPTSNVISYLFKILSCKPHI